MPCFTNAPALPGTFRRGPPMPTVALVNSAADAAGVGDGEEHVVHDVDLRVAAIELGVTSRAGPSNSSA